MRSTEQLSITLPNEMADLVRAKVATGEYATENEVIRDGLRTLLARDRAVEAWLREQVAPRLPCPQGRSVPCGVCGQCTSQALTGTRGRQDTLMSYPGFSRLRRRHNSPSRTATSPPPHPRSGRPICQFQCDLLRESLPHRAIRREIGLRSCPISAYPACFDGKRFETKDHE